jgi:hypothetical protein
MSQLGKLIRLAAAERRLLANALVLVAAMRLALWLLPFRAVRSLVAAWSKRGSNGAPDPAVAARIAWAVTVSSRYVPGATCLTQALAAKLLLRRNRQPAVVRIGVARSEAGKFEAHAWVESDGKIIVGGPEARLERYVSLGRPGDEIV